MKALDLLQSDVGGDNHDLQATICASNLHSHIHHLSCGQGRKSQGQRAAMARKQDVRRNPSRARKPPARLLDYVTYASRYPITVVLHYSKYSTSHRAFLIEVSKIAEPRTFQEASSVPLWKLAMVEELNALEENNTWSIVKLPPRKKVVGSRWVYKTKLKADGSIERHKAKLVARGFTKTFGVDYKETFAPMAKMNIVWVLLSMPVNCGWSMYQMDVKNVFSSWRTSRRSLHTTSTGLYSGGKRNGL